MKIVAIDPGSKVAGYAVTENGILIDAGLIKPAKQSHPAFMRIQTICNEVKGVLMLHRPIDIVVLEWTTGKVGTKRHKGGGSGLAIYGIAIGAIWQTIWEWSGGGSSPKISLIDESWTKGKPKAKRLAELELSFKSYHRKDDKGGDMGDAILLAQYYTTRQLLVREELGK